MIVTLKNTYYEAHIGSKGGEINALISKKTGTDFIWCGDPSVWKFHAPVLFPFVGRIRDGYSMIRGKKCELGVNGFARDFEHTLLESSESHALFELTENDETLKMYPARFSLKTRYELNDKGICFTTTLTNTDNETIFFSIGSHTAFNCPRSNDPNDTKNSDYCIEFEKKEPLTTVCCTNDGYLAYGEDNIAPCVKPYGEKESGIIELSSAGFGNGHFFTAFTSDWVGLRNKKNNSLVKVNTKGFPYLMIWQNAGEPRFVCIEPWNGTPDPEQTNHEWDDKIALIQLESGESFTSDQSISIEE